VSAVYKLKQSRDNWKQKAIDRGEWGRAQKKENARLKKERDRHKKQVKQLWAQLESEKRKPTLKTSGKEELVYFALQLFSVARIGFRAVFRVLSVLSPWGCPKRRVHKRLSIGSPGWRWLKSSQWPQCAKEALKNVSG
jgi:predicted RNase H-like nuclease (RuvC/YqgF family)